MICLLLCLFHNCRYTCLYFVRSTKSHSRISCQQSLVLSNMEKRLDELRREDTVIEIGAKSKWENDMQVIPILGR